MEDSADLPIVCADSCSEESDQHEVWLRISAFLSLKSPNTQRTYLSVLSEWCEFLGAKAGSSQAARKIVTVGQKQALAYRKWLESRPGQKPRYKTSAKGSSKERSLVDTFKSQKNEKRDGLQSSLGNATIAKKLVVLRRIYRLLISCNFYSTTNPFDQENLPVPSVKSGRKRPTEMIPYDRVRELLNLPDERTEKGLRDKAVLSLLFGAGLRRSEVLNLRLGDIRKTQRGTVFLRLRSTKGKTDADQTIPPWAAQVVANLIEQRRKQGAAEMDFLVNSYRGPGGRTATAEPLSDSGLYRMFCDYCQRAGITAWASPHSARATAITRLLDDGLSHREVQEFSRHASVQMVEAYDKRRYGVEKNPAKDIKY
jgi:integrase